MLDVGQLYNFAKLHTIIENKKILSELQNPTPKNLNFKEIIHIIIFLYEMFPSIEFKAM